jgi:hypothetical protein
MGDCNFLPEKYKGTKINFNFKHPYICIFLDKFKQIQLENDIKINSINEPYKYRNSK